MAVCKQTANATDGKCGILERRNTACKWVHMHSVQTQGYANMECAESERVRLQMCKLVGVQAQHAKV